MTRKELINLLATISNAHGTISDDDPVEGIVYMSMDGGMTSIEGARDEYERIEFTQYPVESGIEGDDRGIQLTMILKGSAF